MTDPNASERRLEIDLLRTAAIVAMIAYHACFDLGNFYGWDIDVFSPAWKLFERATAGLFLLLVGVSFSLSRKRALEAGTLTYGKYLKRGLVILACASAVSVATYAFDPDSYVRFGILHLIGCGVLLLPFFARRGLLNVPIIAAIFLTGHVLGGVRMPTEWLLPLGIRPPIFGTLDYFPLFPWFGVTLVGFMIGEEVYVKRDPKPMRSDPLLRAIAWPGKRSLLIYIVHQPLLLLALRIALGAPRIH